MHRSSQPRRATALALAFVAMLSARAEAEVSVPIDLQVDLVRKIVRFERGFATRGGKEVHLLIVTKASNTDSAHAAAQLQAAFEKGDVGGRPVKVATIAYATAAGVRKTAGEQDAQLVYLTPGLDGALADIAKAFADYPAITITTDGDLVARGPVLGFELVSSKPKITLNLAQAKRQSLDFNSDLFRLAKVLQ